MAHKTGFVVVTFLSLIFANVAGRIRRPQKQFYRDFPSDISSGENPFQPRIAGGRSVRAGDVPYQIQLRYLDDYLCGAALVTTKHGNQVVITAGHCITKPAPSTDLLSTRHLSVIGGRVKLDSFHYYEQVHPVTKMFRHLKWRRHYFLHYNDVAVIHFDQPFRENRLVQTIALPWRPNTKPQGDIIISGWGYTNPHHSQQAEFLQLASIKFISNSECDRIYKSDISVSIGKENFCAGTYKSATYQGACQYDDGSPAANVFNNTLYLAGIFNWGLPKCGNRYRPSIFTDLSYYIDWIHEVGHPDTPFRAQHDYEASPVKSFVADYGETKKHNQGRKYSPISYPGPYMTSGNRDKYWAAVMG